MLISLVQTIYQGTNSVEVTKKYEPAYLKEEALAPSPLSELQTALTNLDQDVANRR